MRHTYECVVRWGDMDAFGHVNNVVFADYLQEARVDLLRAHGAGAPTDALAEGTLVVSQHLQYAAPLVFDEHPVLIDVWVAQIKAATFTLAYEIHREAPDGTRTTYATAHTVLTPFSFAEQRPRRINPEERAQLGHFLEETPLPDVTFGEPRADELGHYPVQVRFSDLDVYGHANNVIYLEYFQESRITLMGRQLAQAIAAGGPPRFPGIVVAAVHVEYKRPMVLRAEPYDSWTWVARLGNRSMVLEAQIRDTDGTLISRGQFVMVFVDPATGASTRPDPAFRQVLEGQAG
ncbi:acyl-CoA thioesterase [Nocardioides sp. Kera G14]|uniref:acyl-CoA thioesterase n=1 Tax=Nocardioides sp. Kera G14 TaxID=2884264 RepID=UPI001D129750|nr:thioesterase family protein [Nocardioides sp. Kera G14]UDY24464.1 acyl-CoA thioesterase [Nocardioides sp. Kera G14]